MRALSRSWPCVVLGALWLSTSGCGVVERVQRWWSDEEEPAAAVAADEAGVAEAGVAEGAGTAGEPAAGGTGTAAPASGPPGSAAGTGSASGSTGGSSTGLGGGSTTIPMSFARPPTSETGASGEDTDARDTTGASEDPAGRDEGGTTAGPAAGGSTGSGSMTGTAPPGAGLACVQGTWVIDDFSTYYKHIIRAQAHGRSVRTRGSSGRYTLEFDKAELHGQAEHLRLRYETTLADREVRYTIDIHGDFETTVRTEGADKLRVVKYTGGSIRAKETASFEGGKVQTRRPTLPTAGLFELHCSATALELRPIEGKKVRDAIRFVRP